MQARRWLGVAMLAGLLAAGALWLTWSAAPVAELAAEPRATAPPAAPAAADVARPPPAPLPSAPRPTASAEAPRQATDAVDPCTPLGEAAPPDGYAVESLGGITIAWDATATEPDGTPITVRPLPLAGMVAGILAEAARLTDTAPRSSLLVVVEPTREVLLSRPGAPGYAGAYYDGAVHLTVAPAWTGQLGVDASTLRHEVFHAQLHAGVGCSPRWFDEGVAQYFAGRASVESLLAMLRDGRMPEPTTLVRFAFADTDLDAVERAYTASLAMILAIAPRSRPSAISDAVGWLRWAQTRGDPLALWPAITGDLDGRGVLAAVARRVLGSDAAADLPAALSGTLCCVDVDDTAKVACRRGPAAPDERAGRGGWIDRTGGRRAWCRARW